MNVEKVKGGALIVGGTAHGSARGERCRAKRPIRANSFPGAANRIDNDVIHTNLSPHRNDQSTRLVRKEVSMHIVGNRLDGQESPGCALIHLGLPNEDHISHLEEMI